MVQFRAPCCQKLHQCGWFITFALWQEYPFWSERVRVSTQSSSYRLWSLGTLSRLWTQRHGAAKVRISDNTSCVRTHTVDKLSCAFGHAPIWLNCVGVGVWVCPPMSATPRQIIPRQILVVVTLEDRMLCIFGSFVCRNGPAVVRCVF